MRSSVESTRQTDWRYEEGGRSRAKIREMQTGATIAVGQDECSARLGGRYGENAR
jgi:hypothetical protein